METQTSSALKYSMTKVQESGSLQEVLSLQLQVVLLQGSLEDRLIISKLEHKIYMDIAFTRTLYQLKQQILQTLQQQ